MTPNPQENLRRDFQRDGAVCVRHAVDAEHIALAADAIDAVLADPSPLAKRASADDDGAFVEDFCNWDRLPVIERFIRTSGVAAIAAELMGSDTVRLYHDHVLVKEPGTRQRTPWHQDLPYYNIDGRQGVSMWLPVDPVPRASTLELVAGSHEGEWYLPRSFLDDQAKWFPDGALAELPDIDGRPDDFRILGWELEPGDAVFFHYLTLHAAAGVPGPHRRRVLSVRFLGDDITHAPRPWATSPPFTGLADELPAGAPMDHPLFPVLSDPPGEDRAPARSGQHRPAWPGHDRPADRHRRPPRAAPASPGGHARRAGVRRDPDADRRPHRHDAPRRGRRPGCQPGPRAGAHRRDPRPPQRPLPVQAADPPDRRRQPDHRAARRRAGRDQRGVPLRPRPARQRLPPRQRPGPLPRPPRRRSTTR